MRAKTITILSLAAALTCGCSEDFYNSMNSAPTIKTSVNLDVIDTIKTSAKSNKRSYLIDVNCADPNGNIEHLTANTNGANIMLNGENINGVNVPIELSKEKYDFSRTVEIVPTANGLHTLRVSVQDAFKTAARVEKYMYSFDNMPPVVNMSHSAKRINAEEVVHIFDFATSFDRDERWGGGIDSIFTIVKCLPYIEETGDEEGGTLFYSISVHNNPTIEGAYVNRDLLYDDGNLYYTDVWVWVKDNEGAKSETKHYTLAHVE